MAEHQIKLFDLVVVNLYPFESTIQRPGVTLPEAIEQIDIGGPSLIRAAAKNHAFVTVATDPRQYESIASELETLGGTSDPLRMRLAAECFSATSAYDAAIAEYMGRASAEPQSHAGEPIRIPEKITVRLTQKNTLRYGENPHQSAAVFELPSRQKNSLVAARQLNGKEMSYNNYLDLDSALAIVRCFAKPSAVVIKHNNPCGGASAHKLSFACRKALEGDPLSAFRRCARF